MTLDSEAQRKLLLNIFSQVSPKGVELILEVGSLIIAVKEASADKAEHEVREHE